MSGSIGSATRLTAPPVVLYLNRLGARRRIFPSYPLAFFLPSNVLTIVGLATVGQITENVLILSAAALPCLALGIIFGAWLRRRVRAEQFRTLVVGVFILASVVALVSAIA